MKGKILFMSRIKLQPGSRYFPRLFSSQEAHCSKIDQIGCFFLLTECVVVSFKNEWKEGLFEAE